MHVQLHYRNTYDSVSLHEVCRKTFSQMGSNLIICQFFINHKNPIEILSYIGCHCCCMRAFLVGIQTIHPSYDVRFNQTKCKSTSIALHWEFIYIYIYRPPLWSSGQSSWLQIRRPGFDSRH
jgi:hypothetical protein